MDEGFGRGSEREERAGWATVRITPPLRGPLESLVLDPGVRPAPGDGPFRVALRRGSAVIAETMVLSRLEVPLYVLGRRF